MKKFIQIIKGFFAKPMLSDGKFGVAVKKQEAVKCKMSHCKFEIVKEFAEETNGYCNSCYERWKNPTGAPSMSCRGIIGRDWYDKWNNEQEAYRRNRWR